MDKILLEATPPSASKEKQQRIDGVVIGLLVGLDHESTPLVSFPGCPTHPGINARSTSSLSDSDIGRQVALLFENGDPNLPIVIGRMHYPEDVTPADSDAHRTAKLDGERVVLSAKKEIVLKCGKASITLTRAGKILIRGTYLSSRSSGVNRIKGGSVQLN